MIIGLNKLKEKDGILTKISVVLYNAIFYGYFAFLIINFGWLQNFNALTIGVAILLPINLYLTVDSIKDFSSKRKSHIGSLDFFMNSMKISKKSQVSIASSDLSESESAIVVIFMMYLLMSFFMLMIFAEKSSEQGSYMVCLLFMAIPAILILNNLFNCNVFNKKEVLPENLINFEKVEDINETEKEEFKKILKNRLNQKGVILKKDVLNAYLEVCKIKAKRILEEKIENEKNLLNQKIENAKKNYSFLNS